MLGRIYSCRITPLSRIMSTFVSQVSPVTGKAEWTMQDDDYDYHQEVARSAYADMLHDTERNKKYNIGVKRAVAQMHARGKAANVLDIGTGTGLLSMMAAACGADTVTACEAFPPMAGCAGKIMKKNGYGDKIRLIHKRSTEVTVGPDGDMPQRANILVTEVFDTELIGEGAIGTFHHAHKELLEDDCLVIPRAANMYAQVVESDCISRLHHIPSLTEMSCDNITTPPNVQKCPGAAAVHDLQLDQLSIDQFKPISKPQQVFRFDYTGASPIEFKGHSVHEMQVENSGVCQAVFMWWDIEMDPDGEVLLSCAPRWAHPELNEMQWRDHWMQAIYFPRQFKEVEEGEKLFLQCQHDDYSLWFDVAKSRDTPPPPAPVCRCGAHVVYSRPRMAMLSDRSRNKAYSAALKKVIKEDSVCLSSSDGSLVPLIAGQLGAKQVFSIESSFHNGSVVQNFITHNKLKDRVRILKKDIENISETDLDNKKVDVLISEPFYSTSLLPWHNVYFWYVRTQLAQHLSDGAKVLPSSASLVAVAVEFEHLWKIRAPVGNCEGFDLDTFDKLIEDAADRTDANMEPQPLWEYPGVALTEQFKMATFDFMQKVTDTKTETQQGTVQFKTPGKCNGIAVWMDFHLDEENSISTGLTSPAKPGEKLNWDFYSRQGVHLFKEPIGVNAGKSSDTLSYKIKFDPKTGEFDFAFNVQAQPIED